MGNRPCWEMLYRKLPCLIVALNEVTNIRRSFELCKKNFVKSLGFKPCVVFQCEFPAVGEAVHSSVDPFGDGYNRGIVDSLA